MKTLDFSNQALVLKEEIPKNISYSFKWQWIEENEILNRPSQLICLAIFSASVENQMVVF